jgi:hypothetical protein
MRGAARRRDPGRGDSARLRLFGAGFVLIGAVMLGLALASDATGIAGWFMAFEASLGIVIGSFGVVIVLRPDRLDWTLDAGVGLYALLTLGLAGVSIALLGVVAGWS